MQKYVTLYVLCDSVYDVSDIVSDSHSVLLGR